MVLVATADPTSSNNGISEMICFRELYYSLEHQRSVTSLVALKKQLKQAIAVFRSCGEDYPSSMISSKAKATAESVTLSNGKIISFESQHKALHQNIRELHKLGEAEAVLLLRIFLDSDDANLDRLSSTSDNFVSPLQQSFNHKRRRKGQEARDEDILTQFQDSFTAFYFEERLYVLRCISALISIADDSFHQLNEIAKDILDEFVDEKFAQKCLSRIQQLMQQDLPEDIREVPKYGIFWSKHNLREQLSLLEVVFLSYYSRLEVSAEAVRKIVDVIRHSDFGRAQTNAGFFDQESSYLVDCIGSFLILLFVESLELEKCMEGLDLHSNQRVNSLDKQLIDTPDLVGDIADFLRTSTEVDILRAPLLLAFALFLSRIDSALIEWADARPTEAFPEHLKALQTTLFKRGGVGVLWPEFATASLSTSLNLFSTLNLIITSPLFKRDSKIANIFTLPTSSSLALRAVFKGLILSITQLIRPEYIQDYHGLISVWRNTFTSPETGSSTASESTAAMCAQFWEIDFQYEERRAVLSMATRRFPVNFRPLLQLCRSLSGQSTVIGDDSIQAGTAVLGYLTQMNTLAQVMPATPSLAIPYEPVEASSGISVTYRATRNIPVFGKHLIVPVGTYGTMVSQIDQAPVVMLWQITDSGYSVWRLMRDVLAHFAGLLDVQSVWKAKAKSVNDDSAVFQYQDDSVAHFPTMSPDEVADIDGGVAADVLDLFVAILSGGTNLSTALLSHLDGQDIDLIDPIQPTATSSKPNLIDIVLRLLDQALSSPNKASPVIMSSLQLLNLLIPIASGTVWQALRSSNVLIGSSGTLPFSMQGIGLKTSGVSLLSHEIATGVFKGSLMLLDLYQTLLLDLQRTQFASSTETIRIKVEVVSRAAYYILHHIWTEYQNWKYIHVHDQLNIGKKCTVFLDTICKDASLKKSSSNTKALIDMVESNFLSSAAAPAFAFAPTLRIIADGQGAIDTMQRAARLSDVKMAKAHLLCSLNFILTMLQKSSQDIPHDSTRLGVLESIILKQEQTSSRGLSRPDNLVKAIANMITMPNEEAINIAAIKIMICLCRATSGIQQTTQATTLMGHLGSLHDVERYINGLLTIVSESGYTYTLMIQSWNLLSMIVDSQPALATLLITGKHLSSSVEKHLANSESNVEQNLAHGSKLSKSGLDIAKSVVMQWKARLEVHHVGEAGVLECSLKFLSVAWKHALEHREAFASLHQDAELWNAITQLSQLDAEELPPLPPISMEKVLIGEAVEVQYKSDSSDGVYLFSIKRMCSARSLELFLTDINLSPILSSTNGSERGLAFDRVMSMLSDSDKLSRALQSACRFPCDPLMQDDVVARLAQTFPEMPIEDFFVASRRDDFDYTRLYSDKYVYDVDLLEEKLLGFASSVQDETEVDSMQMAALQQAILLVSGLNLNWCIIDSQIAYLAAWTSLLSGIAGLLSNQRAKNKQEIKAVETTTMIAWIECARITTAEDVESIITGGIHSARVSLLDALLKLSWRSSSPMEDNRQLQHDYGAVDEQIRDVMDQIEQMVTHSIFRVEAAMRNGAVFYRPIFQMVYLGVCKYRQSRSHQQLGGQKEGKAEILRAMQQSAETLTLHTIFCLRIAIDHAFSILSTRDTGYEEAILDADEDIALLTSILEVLLDPDSAISAHIWAPRMHTTSVVSAAIDLFSRSPMQQEYPMTSSDEILASGLTPPFSSTLLTFFFNLANRQSTAELLVLSNIINGLCSNNFSVLIDSSKEGIPPRLANTTLVNPFHTCWIQILQVTMAIVVNLEGPIGERFLQSEAWSFFKVYEASLERILDVCLLMTATSTMGIQRNGDGYRHAEIIRLNQVEEVDLVLRLYTYIIRAKVRHASNEADRSQFNSQRIIDSFKSYTKKATVQLQEFVHLLQHPRELTMLSGGSTEEEEKVKNMLITSSASIVSTLWELTKGDSIMCSEPNDWDLNNSVILPTISTSPSSNCSTGTLLDLATYLVEQITRLRNTSSKEKEKILSLLCTLEQTAALCTTQLVLSAYSRPNAYSMTVRKDVETGLGRDVKQGLESARGAIQSAGHDASFLSVIYDFHSRWLHIGD